jgi:hypothetical protein
MKMIRKVAAAAAMALALAGSAQALTLEPIVGGAFYSEDGVEVALEASGLSFASAPEAPFGAGFAFGGSLLTPVSPLSASGDAAPVAGGFPGTFIVLDLASGPVSTFLTGEILDLEAENGLLTGAARILGGDGASSFGEYALLSLAAPEIGPGTLDDLPADIAVVSGVTLAIDAAREVSTPIPAPAAFPLLLGAAGWLLVLRRRRSGA